MPKRTARKKPEEKNDLNQRERKLSFSSPHATFTLSAQLSQREAKEIAKEVVDFMEELERSIEMDRDAPLLEDPLGRFVPRR